MKTLLMLLCVSSIAIGQIKLDAKTCIKKDKINLKQELVWFRIDNPIEINGHIFLNDTCKDPIVFSASVRGVEFTRQSKSESYEYRDCGEKDCNIVHLVVKAVPTPPIYHYPFQVPYFRNNNLFLDALPGIRYVPCGKIAPTTEMTVEVQEWNGDQGINYNPNIGIGDIPDDRPLEIVGKVIK